MVNFILGDNLEEMKKYDYHHFHLAIVDPPYGIGVGSMNLGKTKETAVKYNKGEWDTCVPTSEYWKELFRISQHQIIWGANYFLEYLGNTPCMLSWNKGKSGQLSFADFELGWTNFNMPSKEILRPRSHDNDTKIHPTQKPIYLYEACFQIFADYKKRNIKNMRVIDTHGGSHSSAIAAERRGLIMTIIEREKEYHESGKAWFKNATTQQMLF